MQFKKVLTINKAETIEAINYWLEYKQRMNPGFVRLRCDEADDGKKYFSAEIETEG